LLIRIITPVELTVQFSKTMYSGTEESGFIRVTVNLLGESAGRSTVIVYVTTLPVTATGEQLCTRNFI